jgi:ABC-type multidrug transport system fused ATPase/permease subunit
MNLFKEVLKKNKKIIVFYIVLGIVISFLSVFCVDYFQEILDAFSNNTLTLSMVVFYGALLLVTTILSYLDTYPEQKVKHGLYLDFKVQALKKNGNNRLSRISKIRCWKYISKGRRWFECLKRFIYGILV